MKILRWAALLLLAGCSSTADRAATPSHPNIIFILADDLGYGDLTCQNRDSKIPTLSMDRLAAEGIRFTDAHSPSAVCTPTRYGILTGRYAWRTRLKRGVLWGYSPPLIEPERTTVASFLKRHGYHTACVGKWHLGLGLPTTDGKPANGKGSNVDFSRPIRGGPTALGFDSFYGIAASLDMPPYVFIEDDRTLGIPNQITREGGREGLTAPGFRAVDVMPSLTEKAVEVVRTAQEPFFLYLPLTAPHTPVVPTEFVKGVSRAGEYGDFVMLVDWTVGRIMDALERSGRGRNTLLIVTSDNGSTRKPMKRFDHLPNGRLRGRKSDIWEGGHRVPFIARWPGVIPAGATSDETLSLVDLLATSAAIVGAELPDGAGQDSYNMLPALKGEKLARPIREATVVHSINGMFAVRQGPWKLVLGRGSGGWSSKGSPEDPPGQLYDLDQDLNEKLNLYERDPQRVDRLTKLLEKYRLEGRSRAIE